MRHRRRQAPLRSTAPLEPIAESSAQARGAPPRKTATRDGRARAFYDNQTAKMTEFRIQNSECRTSLLNSEFCILNSVIFAVPSIPLEHGRLLPREGLERPREVLRRHAHRLHLCLALDRFVERHAPFLMQGAL